ncbi:hypothetical protein FM036_01495 [Nostoc sp. HG1]|nr:hypothetical protein [Nostoc sp. HG1]
MDFFDWKKFTPQQWLVLGASVTILLLFLWSESEKRRPFDEAAQGLDDIHRDLKKIDCDLWLKQQNWAEYDKEKCSSL